MIKNKIGLEVEFFLRDAGGELVLPGDYGFGTDDYIILGECRAMPGKTREETLANFMERWYGVVFRAHRKKLTLDIEDGWVEMSNQTHADLLRQMGTKDISTANNIYGTDILTQSDAIITRGKITGYRASIGLHVHFSSAEKVESVATYTEHAYSPVTLPLTLGGAGEDAVANLSLWRRNSQDAKERKVTATASATRITRPVVNHIVISMDANVLPYYPLTEKLKYRQPGFYEMKSHGGFEYRSLPFNQATLDGIASIVDNAFTLLEEL